MFSLIYTIIVVIYSSLPSVHITLPFIDFSLLYGYFSSGSIDFSLPSMSEWQDLFNCFLYIYCPLDYEIGEVDSSHGSFDFKSLNVLMATNGEGANPTGGQAVNPTGGQGGNPNTNQDLGYTPCTGLELMRSPNSQAFREITEDLKTADGDINEIMRNSSNRMIDAQRNQLQRNELQRSELLELQKLTINGFNGKYYHIAGDNITKKSILHHAVQEYKIGFIQRNFSNHLTVSEKAQLDCLLSHVKNTCDDLKN